MIPGFFNSRYRQSLVQLVVLALALLCSQHPAVAAPHRSLDSIEHLDLQISQTLEHIAEGELSSARLLARMLAWRFPDFALGQLLSAELESTAAFNDVLLAGVNPVNHTLIDLLLEAQARLAGTYADASRTLPQEIIQAGKDVSRVILVDLNNAMLYQYDTQSSAPVLVNQHYAGSGKAGFGKDAEGDNKTPLGVYSILDHRSDESLPELYGSGALTLDYPNAMDQYMGRTGYGIWLHGVPRTQLSRSPRSSEGCVTMSNEHLTRLAKTVDITSTRVILTDQLRQATGIEQEESRLRFRALFERYQRAWSINDQKALRALYHDTNPLKLLSGADEFVVLGQKNSQHRFERRAFLNALADASLDDISIFRNPVLHRSESDTLTSDEQIVISSRFGASDEYQLTLYWVRFADVGWQIVAENLEGTNI